MPDQVHHGFAGAPAVLLLLLGDRLLRRAVGETHAQRFADGLEDGYDIAPVLAGPYRAAIDEHRRTVQARHGHHAARHVLVAAADGDESVEALRSGHGLD